MERHKIRRGRDGTGRQAASLAPLSRPEDDSLLWQRVNTQTLIFKRSVLICKCRRTTERRPPAAAPPSLREQSRGLPGAAASRTPASGSTLSRDWRLQAAGAAPPEAGRLGSRGPPGLAARWVGSRVSAGTGGGRSRGEVVRPSPSGRPVPLPPPRPLPFTAPGPSSSGRLAAPGQPAFALFAFLPVPSRL